MNQKNGKNSLGIDRCFDDLDNPIELFKKWFAKAEKTEINDPNAVAVATSDTWASEIGCLDNRVRMITTLKPCEAGTNGGFSPNGQLAAAVGGILIAVSALLANIIMFSTTGVYEPLICASAVAGLGFLGCQIDSILGAVLENRGFLNKGSVNALSIIAGVAIMWFGLGTPT